MTPDYQKLRLRMVWHYLAIATICVLIWPFEKFHPYMRGIYFSLQTDVFAVLIAIVVVKHLNGGVVEKNRKWILELIFLCLFLKPMVENYVDMVRKRHVLNAFDWQSDNADLILFMLTISFLLYGLIGRIYLGSKMEKSRKKSFIVPAFFDVMILFALKADPDKLNSGELYAIPAAYLMMAASQLVWLWHDDTVPPNQSSDEESS